MDTSTDFTALKTRPHFASEDWRTARLTAVSMRDRMNYWAVNSPLASLPNATGGELCRT